MKRGRLFFFLHLKGITVSTLPPEPKPVIPQEYLISNNASQAFAYFGVCPQARSMMVFSLTHEAPVLFVIPCNTWSCRYCAQRKIKRLAIRVQAAEPNRLLTLTVDPALYKSPKEAWEKTRREVPILARRLRKKFQECEYLRVTEVTKRGWPHYHLLVRSPYIPHSVVKGYWAEQTGAKIVDLRQVTKTFRAYQYLVKYLSKLHKLEWTERHVSTSKRFFPPEEKKHPVTIDYAEPEFCQQHPAQLVTEWFQGRTLHRLSDHAHLVLAPYQRDASSIARVGQPADLER